MLSVALGKRAAVCWGSGAQSPVPRGAAPRACRRDRAGGAQRVPSFCRTDKGTSNKCRSCSKACSEAAAVHQSKHFSHCLVKITGMKLRMPLFNLQATPWDRLSFDEDRRSVVSMGAVGFSYFAKAKV